MADADYRSWVEVLPDFKDFNRTVESAVVGGMAGAGASGSAAMGGTLIAGVGKFAGPLVAAFAALGIASMISDAITTGVDAAIDYLQTSVSIAAEFEQNVGAVSAIFKENAEQIRAWGEQSAESVGLSENSYLQFSSLVGAQLKNLGVPFDEVAGKTNELIVLASDLAAQFGGSTSDAVAALSSLLRGERDPIERYGVSIKQAMINAKLGAVDLSALTYEEQRQAEIVATLGILYDQTADAQGTFKAESETFLNVQQRTQAVLEDTANDLGQMLLPVLTEVMVFVKDELLPMWQEFNKEMGPKLREGLEEIWPLLKDLAEMILPLIPPAIEAVIGALDWLVESIKVVMTFVNLVAGTFSDFFALLAGDITIDEFVARFMERVGAWVGALGERLASVVGFFTDMASDIMSTVASIGVNLYESGRALIQNFINGITSMIGSVGNAVGGLMDWVAGFFPHSPAKRGPFSGPGWSLIGDAGRAITDQFKGGFSTFDVPLTASVTAGRPLSLSTSDEFGAASSPALTADTPVRLDDSSIEKLARVLSGYLRNQERGAA